MKIISALSQLLTEHPKAVITEYQLGQLIYQLYRSKEYRGKKLLLSKPNADSGVYNRILKRLIASDVLDTSRRLPNQVLAILDHELPDETVTACAADPFAYISHHSAMEYHGLAMKKSDALYLTSPNPKMWRERAEQTMRVDLRQNYDGYLASGLPRLARIRLDKIGRSRVQRHSPQQLGDWIFDPEKTIAITTIGQTFLDILRYPEWSGGMKHVLRIIDKFGAHHLDEIVRVLNTSGTNIDKVRFGYLFNERLNISNTAIDNWVRFAQRGGSRKLDPTAEYKPVWSEKWCLSLNI